MDLVSTDPMDSSLTLVRYSEQGEDPQIEKEGKPSFKSLFFNQQPRISIFGELLTNFT